jgi:hypothetical protein
MATKIMIPTPLRPFTDKKDAVEAMARRWVSCWRI